MTNLEKAYYEGSFNEWAADHEDFKGIAFYQLAESTGVKDEDNHRGFRWFMCKVWAEYEQTARELLTSHQYKDASAWSWFLRISFKYRNFFAIMYKEENFDDSPRRVMEFFTSGLIAFAPNAYGIAYTYTMTKLSGELNQWAKMTKKKEENHGNN